MRKPVIVAVAFVSVLILNSKLFSQSIADGLNFSQTFNGGTAKFVSMGGAFGALGSDFSSIGINPAGLGVYKSSEFTITPSFKHREISSTYNGVDASDTKNRLNFDNVGLVLSFQPYQTNENGIVNFNFGFGYNRTNDFYSNSMAKGNFDQSSVMYYLTNKAKSKNLPPSALEYTDDYDPFYGNSTDNWDLVMAWNTWLLFDYDAGTNSYISALFAEDSVDHANVISTEGGSGEYNLSFSVNIANKVYLGASVGITDFNYEYNVTYSEYAADNNLRDINGDRFYFLDYSQHYKTEGTGYNLKIGAIYNPVPSLRIGASIHTPTFYSFDDTYSYSMNSNFDTSYVEVNYFSGTPRGHYDFDFETPFRFIGSLAYIIKDFGLISLDVEHVDYSSMKFRNGGDGDSFTDLNTSIENTYKSVTNIRAGGEYKIGDFSIRGGYAYYPSPYKSGQLNKNAKTTQISGGLGYRSGGFSIDMAYLYTMRDEKYLFYDDPYNNLNPVKTETTDGKFLVTFGFRF